MKITKEQLINKAIELFQTEGFGNVTVEQICASLDVTKGSFYHHFQSKNDILLGFYNFDQDFTLALTKELLNFTSPIKQLWRLFEYSIDRTIRLGPDLLKHLLVLDISQGNHILNPYHTEHDEQMGEFNQLILRIVQKGQEQGEIRQNVPPKDLVFAFVSGLLGVAMNWSANGGGYDEKAELYRLFQIVFK